LLKITPIISIFVKDDFHPEKSSNSAVNKKAVTELVQNLTENGFALLTVFLYSQVIHYKIF